MTRGLSDARKSFLADLAAEVGDEFSLSLPIDLETILDATGLTISFGHYGGAFDGMLECQRGRFHVFCNLDRVETRRSPRARFTLGHELGHYYIDEHRLALAAGRSPAHPSQCDYGSQNLVEQEADFFASSLVMPADRFRTEARAVPRGLAGIRLLAETFQTSLTSTAIRYAQLDLLPCTIIKWSPERFGWKWLSRDTFLARYLKTIERPDDLPPDSATARVLRGERAPAVGFFQNGSTAAAWFRRVGDASARNAILIEQAVSLGRFGALTFLYPEAGTFHTLQSRAR